MIHLGANPVSARQRLDRLDSKNPDWRTKHGTGLVFSSLRIKSTEKLPGLNQIFDALCALRAMILMQPCQSMTASVVVSVAWVVVVLTWSIQLELPMDSHKKQVVQ